jgi:hypothetical protein
VGALICATAAVLAYAAVRKRLTGETVLAATLSAAILLATDLIGVVAGVISPTYLMDAAAESFLLVSWLSAGSLRVFRA